MTLQSFLQSLGTPMQDAEEETFELFAQDLPSQNLGFIDSRATTLELTVAGRDLVITQSPGILSSNRAGGTTGAVVWKITPLFAAWLASPHINNTNANTNNNNNKNPLWAHHLLTPTSRVLELGCGISGLVALLLGPLVSRYVLTDQPYVAKLVEQNVEANWRAAASSSSSSSLSHTHSHSSPSPSRAPSTPSAPTSKPTRRSRPTPATTTTSSSSSSSSSNNNNNKAAAAAAAAHHRRRGSPATTTTTAAAQKAGVTFAPLDWETDAVTAALAGPTASSRSSGARAEAWGEAGGEARGFDVLVACDCVYNEALVEPFVATCVDLCRLRGAGGGNGNGNGNGNHVGVAAEGVGERDGGELAGQPTVCVVAQQLRDPLVFEAWAVRFGRSFHTWRVPDEMLVEGLRANTGFVVHVGVLKGDINLEAI